MNLPFNFNNRKCIHFPFSFVRRSARWLYSDGWCMVLQFLDCKLMNTTNFQVYQGIFLRFCNSCISTVSACSILYSINQTGCFLRSYRFLPSCSHLFWVSWFDAVVQIFLAELKGRLTLVSFRWQEGMVDTLLKLAYEIDVQVAEQRADIHTHSVVQ